MRLTSEQLENAHKTRLGRWNGCNWILAGPDVYSDTPEGLRWEGSYAWFSVAAADRVSRGDTDKSIPHALDCDMGEDCVCDEMRERMPIGWPRSIRPGTDR